MAEHRESPSRRVNPSGRVVWVARYTDSKGRRRSAGSFPLKREAQDAINAAYRRPADATTIAGYLDRWLRTRPRAPRTDRTNEGRIRNVLALELDGLALGDWPLRELKRRHRDDLVALMLTEQGRSAGGARNILRALSAMFEDAICDEFADVNPWQGARVRDSDPRAIKRAREPQVLSFEQMHALAAAAGRYEAMLRVLADCGLRIGELFALHRRDLADGVLTVRGTAWEGVVSASSETKNHSRLVPVPASTLAVLRSVPTRIDVPWLFPSPRGALWRYSNWSRRVWGPACEASGVRAAPHDLRHSWVTQMRAAGIDPADLAQVAGHSEQTATRVYSHPLGESFEAIRRVVG